MKVPLTRKRSVPTREEISCTWQAASLLLGYPDDELLERLPLLRRVVAALPPTLAAPLTTTLEHIATCPPSELQADYVDTFDTRRRHNLFLTYFAHGDTRKRGVALLRFKQAYQLAGFESIADELPDHLCVVLELGATIDLDVGRRLVLDHRAGLELLRLALTEGASPWAGAVTAVTSTLPLLGDDERDAIARLAAEGPPEEEVGLTPYATPGFDPATAGPPSAAGPIALPTPTFPGAR